MGPGANQDAVYNSVIHRLKLGDTNVFNSKVKFDKVKNAMFEELRNKYKMEKVIDAKEITKIINKLRKVDDINKYRETLETFKIIQKSDRKDKINRVTKEFFDNNYFDIEHGVWVRKSTLSYIF